MIRLTPASVVFSSLAVIAISGALLVARPPIAQSHVVASPEGMRRYAAAERSRAEWEFAQLKPGVDLAVQGDYEGALTAFRTLEPTFRANDAQDMGRSLLRDELLCLIHLRRGEEGLGLLRTLGPRDMGDHDRTTFATVLALFADDESAMFEALGGRVRVDRIENSTTSRQFREALTRPVLPSDVHVANQLMTIACEFGEDYDDEMLHRLGQEAIRRGCTDQTLLRDYANWCQLNGNLREGVALCRQLEQSATDPEIRSWAHRQVYDTSNIIVQFTRHHSIEQEERQRHEDYRTHFFRHMW